MSRIAYIFEQREHFGTAQIQVEVQEVSHIQENQKKMKHSRLIGDIYSLVFGLFDPFIKMEMLKAVNILYGPPIFLR